MVLSKRERYIGFSAGAAVLLLAMNSFILDPLLAEQADLDIKIDKAHKELSSGTDLVLEASVLNRRLNDMFKSGLLRDETAATNQFYTSVSTWSRESRFDPPPALKSDKTDREKDFQKINMHASGSGSFQQISRLLYRMQTANVPVRITQLQLSSKKDGVDDLKMDMDLATIYFSPAQNPGQPSQSASIDTGAKP
jgi:hypothetical protein